MPARTTTSASGGSPKTAAKTASAPVGGPPNPPSRPTRSGGLVTYLPTDGPNDRVFINPDGVEVVGRMAANAHNLETIASALGVSRRALGRAFEAQPDLKDAFDTGRAGLEQELGALLLEKARGGNVTCAIFLLKAQCGWRDTGVDAPRGPTVAVQINLPAAMSEAAYAKLIEEKRSDSSD